MNSNNHKWGPEISGPYRDNFETVLPKPERPRFSDAFFRTRKPKRLKIRWVRWAIEGLVVSTALWALVSAPHGARVTAVTPSPTPMPVPVNEPTPPVPSAASPEVRRAEGVVNRWTVSWSRPIPMPYGEMVQMKLLGSLPTQDDLPWSGNQIGDAYQIGNDVFVWVKPFGGEAKWIDPK